MVGLGALLCSSSESGALVFWLVSLGVGRLMLVMWVPHSLPESVIDVSSVSSCGVVLVGVVLAGVQRLGVSLSLLLSRYSFCRCHQF